jgi:hypothetical protein
MKNILFIILIPLFLIIFYNNTALEINKTDFDSISELQSKQYTQTKLYVDKIHIGMTIQEMKDVYTSANFIEEPVYKYGIDGESNGLVVEENGNRLFFVWTLENENEIRGITIISKDIKIDDNVSVGMTLAEFIKKYPEATLAIDLIDNKYEFSYVAKLKYRIEFLTTDSTRVAEYSFGEGEPEYIKIINLKKKVDRISLY